MRRFTRKIFDKIRKYFLGIKPPTLQGFNPDAKRGRLIQRKLRLLNLEIGLLGYHTIATTSVSRVVRYQIALGPLTTYQTLARQSLFIQSFLGTPYRPEFSIEGARMYLDIEVPL